MSLTSHLHSGRYGRPLAYALSFLEAAFFWVVSASCFLGAMLLLAAIAGEGRQPVTDPRRWVGAAPIWMHVLAILAYPLLGLAYWLGPDKAAAAGNIAKFVAYFVKAVFFLGISAAYFAGVGVLYVLIARAAGGVQASQELSVGELLGEAPKWAYAVVAAVLLLLITVYWSPRKGSANEIEVRAFTAFLIAALAVIGYFAFKVIAALPFWRSFTRGQ